MGLTIRSDSSWDIELLEVGDNMGSEDTMVNGRPLSVQENWENINKIQQVMG